MMEKQQDEAERLFIFEPFPAGNLGGSSLSVPECGNIRVERWRISDASVDLDTWTIPEQAG
jgi:hypothetical protein